MKCKKCGQDLPIVKCAHCGKEFKRSRKDNIYCSKNCKVYAFNEKKKAKG